MRTVLLLKNLVGFPSMSMDRYAGSLATALGKVEEWRVKSPDVAAPALLERAAGKANASRWGRLVKYPAEVRRLSRELRPDVVHVVDHSHANLLRASDPARSVVTVHDVIPMLSVAGELNFRVRPEVRYTFPRKLRQIGRCARVITVSESTKRQLLRFIDLPPERVHVTPLGVADVFNPGPDGHDREAERRQVLAEYDIDPTRKVVLHVCTRNRYKNSPALLRALAKLPDEFLLLRVGAPLFDDERGLAADLGVEGRVINAGRVATDDGLAAHYRSADVFAFPSTFEGFGWPPLEAMACGCPTVVSNAASLPEVIGDAGPTVEPEDADALAAAIVQLADDRTTYARRSLERAARFTWSACATATAAVYDKVVAEVSGS